MTDSRTSSSASLVSSDAEHEVASDILYDEVEDQWISPGFCGHAASPRSARPDPRGFMDTPVVGVHYYKSHGGAAGGREMNVLRASASEPECLYVPEGTDGAGKSAQRSLRRTVAWGASDFARAKAR